MKSKKDQYRPIPILSISSHNNEFIDIFKISKKDAWGICDFIVANEDRLFDFFPGTREQNLTPDLSERFTIIKEKQFEAKEEFLFTLRIKDDRKIIGLVYIKALDWVKKQGEFAYAIDYNYEGKGITSKIIKELSKYAFETLGLKTLQIIVHKTNLGSIRVAEKCNFTRVKTLKGVFVPKGRDPLDMELYELYKS